MTTHRGIVPENITVANKSPHYTRNLCARESLGRPGLLDSIAGVTPNEIRNLGEKLNGRHGYQGQKLSERGSSGVLHTYNRGQVATTNGPVRVEHSL